MIFGPTRRWLWLEQHVRLNAVVVAAATVAVLIIGWFIAPAGALRALLFAWLLWLGVAMGSAVWLAIFGVTGGRWAEAARPLLVNLARHVPILALVFVLIALGARELYPWASEPADSVRSGVSAIYLSWPAFAVRGAVILTLWWCIAAVVAAARAASVLWSGVGLALYGLTVTFAAVDWSMSLAAPWASTAFPAEFALTQLTSALAVVAMLRPGNAVRETRALAQLLLACILGVTYFVFMQFLVIWSGNLPDKVAWFVARGGSWRLVIAAAFLLGAVLPFLLLLRARARENPEILRLAGGAVFAGVVLLDLWQIAPGIGAGWWLLPLAAATAAALALVAPRSPLSLNPVRGRHDA